MRQTLITLLVLVMLAVQTTCNQVLRQVHESDTVVGNLLAEPYLAIILSLLCIFATLI